MDKLKRLDLNLLLALDVLLDERSVTRSAARLSLSQPATSATLARLRASLGDQLLVRSRSEMFLTARANALRQPIKDALRAIENALEAKSAFVASAFDGKFRLAMTDLASFTLGSNIAIGLYDQAPHASIEFIALDRTRLYDWFKSDSIDAAVVVYGADERMFESEPLFEDELVFVTAKAHPLNNRRTVHISRLTSFPLVEVSVAAAMMRPFLKQVEAQGHKWAPTVTVPHFLIVPSMLQNNSFVGIMGRVAANHFAGLGAAAILKTPEPLPKIPYKLVWHRQRSHDPAHRWMRELVRAGVAQTVRSLRAHG